MSEIVDRPDLQTDSIYVRFCFVDGDSYTQEIYMKDAHMIENILKWYRYGKNPIWTFDYSPISKISLFNKAHIMSIEIDGYIELARVNQKWYEKLADKLYTKWLFLHLKGGDTVKGKKNGKGGRKC